MSNNQPNINITTEGNNMEIHHFLRNVHDGDEPVVERHLSTWLTDVEAAALATSKVKGGPVEGYYAINSGNYIPRFLQERLANKGYDFRLTIISLKDMDKLGDYRTRIAARGAFWATDSSVFFMKIKGVDGFEETFRTMGLSVDFTKKIGKRLQEVGRMAAISYYTEDMDNVVDTMFDSGHIARFEHPKGVIMGLFETPEDQVDLFGDDAVKIYDGMNKVHGRFLLKALYQQPYSKARNKLIFRVKTKSFMRGQLRVEFKEFLLKGDFEVVWDDDAMNGCDIVYHTENMKRELRADVGEGFFLFTAMEHRPIHHANFNRQSVIFQGHILTPEMEANSIDIMYEDGMKIITEGTIPTWMQLSQTEHDDESGQVEMYDIGGELARAYKRWQMAGAELFAAQNFGQMALGGVSRRMESGWTKRGYYRKMYIPMINAVSAAVTTYSCVTRMAGRELGFDGSKVFHLTGVGMVIPDHRFIETFRLHDTHDLDDTEDFVIIKIWSSSPQHTFDLMKDGVLDKAADVPNKASEATYALAMIRNPNSPGCYSIELFDGEPEWLLGDDIEFRPELVETIDLATCPRGIDFLLPKHEVGGLPKDTLPYGGPLKAAHGLYMIQSQLQNPGIGRLANILMLHADTFGVSYPADLLDEVGEMYDAVLQGFNRPQFLAIHQNVEEMTQTFVNNVNSTGATVDKCLAMMRLSSEWIEQINPDLLVEKRQAATSNAYRFSYEELSKKTRAKTLGNRANSKLVAKIQKIDCGRDMISLFRDFRRDGQQLMSQVDEQYSYDPSASTFEKISKSYYRSEAMTQVVDMLMQRVRNMGEHSERFLLGFYQWITSTTEHQGWENGLYDRIIFQTGANGGVFDLLLEVLSEWGLLTD